MDRFKNILYYADAKQDNSTAIQYAAALASNNNAAIKIIDVIKEDPVYLSVLSESLKDLNLHEFLREKRGEELEQMATPFKSKGLNISVKVLSGTPFIEVIKEVIRHTHDILITSDGITAGMKEMIFGTTVMHLMRKCPCPIWAIKPSGKDSFSRILAAVDINPDNTDEIALNEKILKISSSLAQTETSELHVVHAWDLPYENMLRYHARIPDSEIAGIADTSKQKHSAWLKKLVRRFHPTLPYKNVHLLKGDPAEMIVELTSTIHIDLIVMGTLSRSGISGLFIGNTAEKILQRVNCSVLAIKPDGFVSPVEPD